MNMYIILSLAIVLNALANILMKVAMRGQEKTVHPTRLIIKLLFNPVLLSGLLSFALALVAYCYVLSKLNLSIAYPIMTSLGFLIVVLVSWIFLGETITLVQVIGFICIIAGVWMVAQ